METKKRVRILTVWIKVLQNTSQLVHILDPICFLSLWNINYRDKWIIVKSDGHYP